MGTSVFGSDTGKPMVFKAGKAIVTINKQTLIALDVNISFQRSVEVIPAIGRKKIVSLGEPNGTFSASTMLSRSQDVFEAFGLNGNNDCDGFDMTLSFGTGSGSCELSGKTITAKNCFASVVSISANGARGFISSGVQIVFTALDV